MSDRQKEDEKAADGDFIEINPYGDMACTIAFLAQFAAILWHAKERSKNEGEEYVLYQLVLGTIALIFGIFVCKKIGGEMAKWISKNFVATDPMNNKPLLLAKFSDQFWQLIVHVSMTTFELVVLAETNFSWVWDVNEVCRPPPWEQTINPLIEKFYITQLCIWIATGLSHKFLEERHKDYFVMYIHHIVTLGLIFGSWSYNYTRYGLLVLAVHDSSDIMIDLLKMSNVLKLQDRQHFYIVETVFGINLFTWALTRGWYLGTQVLASSMFGCTRAVTTVEQHENLSYWELYQLGVEVFPLFWAMNILLWSLLLMNAYWYYLLIKILIGKTKGHSSDKVGKDHYEGSDNRRAKPIKAE